MRSSQKISLTVWAQAHLDSSAEAMNHPQHKQFGMNGMQDTGSCSCFASLQKAAFCDAEFRGVVHSIQPASR